MGYWQEKPLPPRWGARETGMVVVPAKANNRLDEGDEPH